MDIRNTKDLYFTSAAQITAYYEARMDRWAFRDGRAREMHLQEPGMAPAAPATIPPPSRTRKGFVAASAALELEV